MGSKRFGNRRWTRATGHEGGRKKPIKRSWQVFVLVWSGAALTGVAYGGGWFGGLSTRLKPVETVFAANPAGFHAHFGYCKWGGGTNCVVDGDTFYLDGAKVRIADIDAPETHDYRCGSELELGERAARQLQALLNSGAVKMTSIDRDRDSYGRLLRNVSVNGHDVGRTLVSEGLARWYGRGKRSWC